MIAPNLARVTLSAAKHRCRKLPQSPFGATTTMIPDFDDVDHQRRRCYEQRVAARPPPIDQERPWATGYPPLDRAAPSHEALKVVSHAPWRSMFRLLGTGASQRASHDGRSIDEGRPASGIVDCAL